MKHKLISLAVCVGLICALLAPFTANASYTVVGVENLSDGIVAYKEARCGASSVQEWIDTGLSADAGTTAEYYAITLSQSGGYDLSRYEKALLNYLNSHEVYSATTREKYALALIACGSRDSYITHVSDNDIGGLGLMSLVFGLHILNNGYTSSKYSINALIGEILSCQLSDGGWAVIGTMGDADVTTMTVQSLAPYYGSDSAVTSAIDRALSLLSSMQLNSGGYRSMGAENCESAAQVVTALSSLGIDAQSDPRFQKNGSSVLDAMLSYRNSDGSFSHAGDGSFNENATIQAFYSLRAYLRMQYGQTPYYILDRRNPPAASGADSNPVPTAAPKKANNNSNSNHYNNTNQNGNNISDESTVVINGNNSVPSTNAQGEPATVPVTEAATAHPTDATRSESVAPTEPVRFQSADATMSPSTVDETASPKKGGYKLYAILGVLAAGGAACIALLILKKRGVKHYLAVAVLCAGAIVFLLLTNFESPEQYRTVEEKPDSAGTVTMTIRCDTILDEEEFGLYTPDDGSILDETTFTVSDGDTVYDILLEASKAYDIPIDNTGGESSAYIAGIQYIYEYDYGDLSGWMYRVNGVFPEVGCGNYVLADGDRIEWLYTKNIGKDL
jgi:hypothetical protein